MTAVHVDRARQELVSGTIPLESSASAEAAEDEAGVIYCCATSEVKQEHEISLDSFASDSQDAQQIDNGGSTGGGRHGGRQVEASGAIGDVGDHERERSPRGPRSAGPG